MSDLYILFEELQNAIEKKRWHTAGEKIREIERQFKLDFKHVEDLFIDWKNANGVAA